MTMMERVINMTHKEGRVDRICNNKSLGEIKKEMNNKWKNAFWLDDEEDLKIEIVNRENITLKNFEEYVEELINTLNKNKVMIKNGFGS